jgi:hypothetical protein
LARRKHRGIDLNGLLSSAVDAFLDDDSPQASSNGSSNGHRSASKRGDHRLGSAGAVVLGVAAVAAGRAVFNRARNFDLAESAAHMEDRLKR